jgi:hypothetical protein
LFLDLSLRLDKQLVLELQVGIEDQENCCSSSYVASVGTRAF